MKNIKVRNIMIIVIVLVVIVGVAVFVITNGSDDEKKYSDATVVLYDGPETLADATPADLEAVSEYDRDFTLKHCVDTTILVNGKESYVYDTNVNHTRRWNAEYKPEQSRTPITYFGFEGEVEIEVKVPEQELEKVTISPLSYGIEPEIDKENHTVIFTISQPDAYTIMFNDSPERAIHIFANPLEKDVPNPDDENVLYIEPGEWDLGEIKAESGQTIYIAGGAVVHGRIFAENKENITIMGRGIIDGSTYEGWKGTSSFVPVEINSCKDVVVKDVLLLNSNAWVCQGYDTQNMEIDGIKIISSRPNDDGISLQSCVNVQVKNSFVRSWDDSLVIKNYAGSSSDIHFTNMQLWTDFAQSMEIGYETNKGKIENATITDITFEDILVLHNYHKPVVSIHNGDNATISDILFSNITVEDAQMGSGDSHAMAFLIDFNMIINNQWTTTFDRGQIKNITIDGLKVLSGKFCESRIQGAGVNHLVSNVTIKNMEILGEKITDLQAGKIKISTKTTSDITVE